MKQNIEEKIKALVAEHFGIEKDEVTTNFSFTEDFSATPVEITDFLTLVEHEFNVKISTDEIKNLTSVGKLIEFLEDNTDEF